MKNYGTPVTYLNMSLGTRKLLQLNIRQHPSFIQLKSSLEDQAAQWILYFQQHQESYSTFQLSIDIALSTKHNQIYDIYANLVGTFYLFFLCGTRGVQVTSNIKAFKYTPSLFCVLTYCPQIQIPLKKIKICTFVKFVKDTTPRI